MERGTSLQSFLLHFFFKVSGKWAPLHVPHQGPYGERSFISRANGLLIYSFISVTVPSTELSHKKKRVKYLVTVHGAPRGQKAYIQWGAAWFPNWGSFTTLQCLPPCHAAFNTIPYTLAWVDQSPVSRHVS